MFSLREPSVGAIERVLADAAQGGFSYQDVGLTRGAHPARIKPLRERARIGAGEAVYQAACAQAQEWRMYQLG